MKKMILALMLLLSIGSYAGQVDLPTERLTLPELQGDYLVCVWDETANDWYMDFANYDHQGSIQFLVPEWDKWYWIGLWDSDAGEYVFGKWVGHFLTD